MKNTFSALGLVVVTVSVSLSVEDASEKCNENEVYKKCGRQCTCENTIYKCRLCEEGCLCKRGYYRHFHNNKCVLSKDCFDERITAPPTTTAAATTTAATTITAAAATDVTFSTFEDLEGNVTTESPTLNVTMANFETYLSAPSLNSESPNINSRRMTTSSSSLMQPLIASKECGENEELSTCDNRRTSCTLLCREEKLYDSRQVCNTPCNKGCICKPGYCRLSNRQCVKSKNPPSKAKHLITGNFRRSEITSIAPNLENVSDCEKNAQYSTCGAPCQLTCKKRTPEPCTPPCLPGCYCIPGYVRDSYNNCISTWACPD